MNPPPPRPPRTRWGQLRALLQSPPPPLGARAPLKEAREMHPPACCCFSCSASACSCGSLSFSLSCTCLPKLLLLRAVRSVTGAAAARRIPEACSPVLDTSLMVTRPAHTHHRTTYTTTSKRVLLLISVCTLGIQVNLLSARTGNPQKQHSILSMDVSVILQKKGCE
jgi:hypothetical protein